MEMNLMFAWGEGLQHDPEPSDTAIIQTFDNQQINSYEYRLISSWT
jgi:hypothetical protein